MEYFNKARLLFVFIQVYIMRLLANSSYCDRCSEAPTTCREVSGTFAVTVMSKGYNPVVTVPVGACFLNITERQQSENYLALKSMRSGYIFNGMWLMSSPGTYHGAGTDFQYARADRSCPGDCIYSKGPTREELIVQLLYHNISPGVDYSYKIPYYLEQASEIREKNGKTESSPYKHTTTSNKGASESSTASKDTPAAQASGIQRNSLTDSRSYYTASQIQADVTQQQKTNERRYSEKERRHGSRRRQPVFSSDFRRPRTREDVRQSMHRRRNPDRRQPLRERTYSLNVDHLDAQERPDVTAGPAPAANVLGTDVPTDTGVTNEVTIHGEVNYAWRTNGYTQCSLSCGGGIKQPILGCLELKTGSPVTASFCQGQIKPELTPEPCNEAACLPDWEAGQWSACSKSCGEGEQVRLVFCQQRISQTNILNLTEDQCLGRKPASTRPCRRPSCSSYFYWHTSDWSDCSVLCGSGVRNRRVFCKNEAGRIVNDSQCSQPQPRSSRSCDLGSCTRHWYHSSWNNKCSEDCGSGIMSRKVYCITDSGRHLPDEKCDLEKKPSDEKTCSQNTPCSGRWFTGPWSKCTVPCGEGWRERSVLCVQKTSDGAYHILDASQCIESNKPTARETCRQDECETMWYMTDWSKCSVSCGGGVKHRHVQCLNNDMEHSTLCSERERPADMASCNEDRCWTRRNSHNNGCVDRYPNCVVVVQTRLCRYPYYQRNCCRSCSGWP